MGVQAFAQTVALYKLSAAFGNRWQRHRKGLSHSICRRMLPSSDTSGGEHPNSLLKVVPYQLLPGEEHTAVWDHGTTVFSGTDFIDQELQFRFDESLIPARLDSKPEGRIGLKFSGSGKITISFETAVQIVSLDSVRIGKPDGEFLVVKAQWCGVAMGNSCRSPKQLACGFYDCDQGKCSGNNRALINHQRMTGALYKIVYKLPDIPMAILPDAPAFYALKTVTQIERARVSGNLVFAHEGDPIIEFAYFRTASGPALES